MCVERTLPRLLLSDLTRSPNNRPKNWRLTVPFHKRSLGTDNEVSQDVAEGGRLVCRLSWVTYIQLINCKC